MPILIQGPTGSGKEVVAREVHNFSNRSGPFVPFNVCAVGEGTAESELFGHVRGAFTGAHQGSRGLLASADGGTVLLDEINGMSLSLQAKLLRALDSKEVRPVGATRPSNYNFRVIAAANQNLRLLSEQKVFRNDLYYRLSGVVLNVPSLAERIEDIPVLVRHFEERIHLEDGLAAKLTPSAVQHLQRYQWPGNIRQLHQIVRRAIVLAESPRVGARDIQAALLPELDYALDGLEDHRSRLLLALSQCNHDVDSVARELGVHAATVYRWMHREGISTRRYRTKAGNEPRTVGDL